MSETRLGESEKDECNDYAPEREHPTTSEQRYMEIKAYNEEQPHGCPG